MIGEKGKATIQAGALACVTVVLMLTRERKMFGRAASGRYSDKVPRMTGIDQRASRRRPQCPHWASQGRCGYRGVWIWTDGGVQGPGAVKLAYREH